MKVLLLSMTLIFSVSSLHAHEGEPVHTDTFWNCAAGMGQKDSPVDYERFCAMEGRERQLVRDSFQLARALYIQGKFNLCLEQLDVLNTKVARFENSEELRQFCDQGAELLNRTAEIEKKRSIRRTPSAIEKIKKSN